MSRPPGSGEKRLPRFPAELSFLFLFPYLPQILLNYKTGKYL
jgi:hypothetical protein